MEEAAAPDFWCRAGAASLCQSHRRPLAKETRQKFGGREVKSDEPKKKKNQKTTSRCHRLSETSINQFGRAAAPVRDWSGSGGGFRGFIKLPCGAGEAPIGTAVPPTGFKGGIFRWGKRLSQGVMG